MPTQLAGVALRPVTYRDTAGRAVLTAEVWHDAAGAILPPCDQPQLTDGQREAIGRLQDEHDLAELHEGLLRGGGYDVAWQVLAPGVTADRRGESLRSLAELFRGDEDGARRPAPAPAPRRAVRQAPEPPLVAEPSAGPAPAPASAPERVVAACGGCSETKEVRAGGLCGACFWGGLDTAKVAAALQEVPRRNAGGRQRSQRVGERMFGGMAHEPVGRGGWR